MGGLRSVVHGVSDVLTSVSGPRLLEATIQVVLAAMSPGADSIPQNRGRRPGEPQRTGRRCGSRASPDATGTSPAPSTPAEVPGDGRPTDLSPDRADVRPSPSDASRVGLLRCRGPRA